MNMKVVIVEQESNNEVTSFSGLMLNDKYVLITGNLLQEHFINTNLSLKLKSGHIDTTLHLNEHFFVKHKENNTIIVKKFQLLGGFLNKDIYNSSSDIFDSWKIEGKLNTHEIKLMLALFFVLKLYESDADINDFMRVLALWWNNIKGSSQLCKGLDIFSISAPFGNTNFIESYAHGIVSNVLGLNGCLILSDIPSAPCSEGSPVFTSFNSVPEGVIISSLNWWKGEWLGLTLIADIRPVLKQLLFDDSIIKQEITENHQVSLVADYTLVKVLCRNTWRTGIVISKPNGLIITNSHVVAQSFKYDVYIIWRDKKISCTVLFRTPDNEGFDLAVLHCVELAQFLDIKSIGTSKTQLRKGDVVYSAGCSIFSKYNASPTISKGHVSSVEENMIQTTASVHGGSSGGAILTTDGQLAGIIVCNVTLPNKSVYPRVNMAIPFWEISGILDQYIQTKDTTVLNKLKRTDITTVKRWRMLKAQL